jgi:DNA-binding GntR family transcriptional regulator
MTGMHRTLAETAASELHHLILSGELPSGSPLRLEELAQRLRMSQMPVREGLRRLETLGLVEIVPHRGAWVREMSADDLRDTYETRIALESLATRAAAGRFTDADARIAAEALAELTELSLAGDEAGSRAAHSAFHFGIYRAGGSRWLLKAIEPSWQNSERYRFGLPQTPERFERHRGEHQAILDASIAHDVPGAEAALRRHLEGAVDRITESMTSEPRHARRSSHG